jgi:hypothetical protein
MEEASKRNLLTDRQSDLLVELKNRGLVPAASKAEIGAHIQSINPDDYTEPELNAYATEWAERPDLSSSRLKGRTTSLTAEEYFQQHKTGADRIKYVQNQYKPGKHADIASEYDAFEKLEDEQKLARAQELGAELDVFGTGGLIPSREAIVGRIKKEGAIFGIGAGDDEAARNKALVSRVRGELLAKDFAKVRAMFEGSLSQESEAFAVEAARTGVWPDLLFDKLPVEEQELAGRYARLLRQYDQSSVVGEMSDRFRSGLWKPVAGTFEFVKGKTQDIAIAGAFGLGSVFGDPDDPEGVATLAALTLAAKDDLQRQERIKDFSTSTKFIEREGLSKGATIFAESVPYMLYATASGPAAALRGGMLVASMANEYEGQLIDAGVDPERAYPLAATTAFANFYIERLVDLPAIGKVPKSKLVGVAAKVMRSGASRFGSRVATVGVGETLEEVAQGINEELAKQLGLSEADATALVGVAAETVEEMGPALPFFIAMGEGMAGTNSLLSRNVAAADLAAHDATTAADQFETVAQQKPADPVAFEARVRDGWEALTTDKERVAFLSTVNAADPVAANEALKAEQLQEEEVQKRATPLAEQAVAALDEAAHAQEDTTAEQAIAEEAGLTVEAVEEVVDSTGRLVSALSEGGTIKVSPLATRVDVLEEVFHGVRDELGITGEQWKLVEKSVEAYKAATGRDVQYGDLTSVEQAAEAIDRTLAEAQSADRGVVASVFNWLKRVVNAVKGLGFTTERDIGDAILARAKEGGPVEGAAAAPAQERAARFTSKSPRLDATRVALSRMAAGKSMSAAQVEALFPEADIDGQQILNDAREELASVEEFETGTLERAASFSEGARRAEVKRIRREAVVSAREGLLAEQAARATQKKKEAVAATRRDRAIARLKKGFDGVPAFKVKRDHGLDVNKAILNNEDVVNQLLAVAEKTAPNDNIKDPVTAHHVARTLSKSLKQAARSMVTNKTLKSTTKADILDQADRISNLKTAAAAIKESNEVLARIRNNIITATEGELKASIKKRLAAFNRAPSKLKREIKEKTSKRGQLILRTASKLWNMSSEKYEEVKETEAWKLQNLGTKDSSPAVAASQEEIENTVMAIRMIDQGKSTGLLSDLEQTLNNIELFALKSDKALAEKRRRIEEQQRLDTDTLVADLQKQANNKSAVEAKAGDMLSSYLNPIDMLDSMTSTEAGQALFEQVRKEVDTNWNLMKTESLRLRDKLDSKIKALTGKDLGGFARSLRKSKDGFEKYSTQNRTRLTKADLAKLIFQLERGDIGQIAETNPHVKRRLEQLDEMKAEFSPNELEALEVIRRATDDIYRDLAPKIEEETGLPPTHVDNYFKLTWNRKAPGAGGIVRTVTDVPGFVMPTVKHKLDLQEGNGDFFDLALNHIDEMLMFKHFDSTKTRVRGGLLSSRVMDQVQKTFGKKTRDMYDHQMTDMIAGEALIRSTNMDEGLSDKVFGVTRAGAAYTALAGRIPSSFRQLADILSPLLILDFKMTKQVLENMSMDRARKFWDHTLTQERFRGKIDEGSANILDRLEAIPIDHVRKGIGALMRVPGFGDAVSMSVVGGAMVEVELSTDPKYKWMPEDEAYDAAVANVVGQLERIMQSSNTKDLSPEIRDAGQFKRGFTQFLTADLAKLSKEVLAFKKFKAGAPDAKRNLAKVLFVNHVLLTLPQLGISFFLQNFIGGDEFDEDELLEIVTSILAGPFRGIAMVGSIMFSLSMKGGRPSFSTPAQRLAGNVTSAMDALFDTDYFDSEEVMDLLDKWLKMIGTYRDTKDVKKFMEDNL